MVTIYPEKNSQIAGQTAWQPIRQCSVAAMPCQASQASQASIGDKVQSTNYDVLQIIYLQLTYNSGINQLKSLKS